MKIFTKDGVVYAKAESLADIESIQSLVRGGGY
jgi:hypothetical protein